MNDVVQGVDTSRDLVLRALTFILLSVFMLIIGKIFRNQIRIPMAEFLGIFISINLVIASNIAWWRTQPTSTGIITKDSSWANLLDADPNWIFQLLLFIPLAYFLSSSLNRIILPLTVLGLLSFIIEILQQRLYWGYSKPADLVANISGALIGVMLARLKRK